jgi:hypothetical protein
MEIPVGISIAMMVVLNSNIFFFLDKDVIRTDRKHPFYKEEPSNTNPKKLYDILMTYCMYNFDLGG